MSADEPQRPRILHVLDSSGREWEGIARLTLPIIRRLRPTFEFHALFLDRGGPLVDAFRAAGAHVHNVPWARRSIDVRGALRYIAHLRQGRYRIIHAHTGGRTLVWASRYASGATVICHLYSRLGPDGSTVSAIRIPKVNAVLANCQAVADLVKGGTAAVVYPGVDPPERSADPDREPVVVGVAGRLIASKGLGVLLRAFASMAPTHPEVRLEICGTGPARELFEREAEELGLSERIRFLGWVPDVLDAMANWQIFAHPTMEDALPVAVLDAMNVGLPVIASSAGGVPEAVADGTNGYLVPPGDAAALSERLRALVGDARLRRRMGEAGRHTIDSRFSADQMVSRIRDIYFRSL